MFIVWDSRGKRLTNNIRFHINKQFNTNVQYTYSIPLILHPWYLYALMKESNAIPKSKSHWISTFLIVARRLETAAADEADGDGLVQWSRPQQHPVKSQNEILMMSVC